MYDTNEKWKEKKVYINESKYQGTKGIKQVKYIKEKYVYKTHKKSGKKLYRKQLKKNT